MDEVRKMKKLIIFVLPLLLLSACSIMDISLQETAMPLPGGTVDVAVYEGLGIELSTMLREGDADEGIFMPGWFVSGFKLGVPLAYNLDLNSRIYLSSNTMGTKIGPKIVISERNEHYLAAIPAFTAMISRNVEQDYDKYASLGAELTLVSTWAGNPVVLPSVSARFSYDRLFEEDRWRDPPLRAYDLMHGGLGTSLRISLGSLYLHPELGVELVPMLDGAIKLLPNGSLGLGLEL